MSWRPSQPKDAANPPREPTLLAMEKAKTVATSTNNGGPCPARLEGHRNFETSRSVGYPTESNGKLPRAASISVAYSTALDRLPTYSFEPYRIPMIDSFDGAAAP